jgi:hypothetical protein
MQLSSSVVGFWHCVCSAFAASGRQVLASGLELVNRQGRVQQSLGPTPGLGCNCLVRDIQMHASAQECALTLLLVEGVLHG